MEYHIRWRGQVSGPFTAAEVRRMWRAGRISSYHQVAVDGKSWKALAEHPDFGPEGPAADETGEPSARRVGAPSAPLTLARRKSSRPPDLQVTELPDQAGVSALNADRRALAEVVMPATPEPDHTQVFAELPKRAFAALLDGFVVTATAGAICAAPIALLHFARIAPETVAAVTRIACGPVWVLVAWVYHTSLERSATRGTLGMTALGLEVVDANGYTISLGAAHGRFWMKAITLLSLGMGFVAAQWTARRQALHDAVAGTFVVDLDSLRPDE